MRTKTYCCYGAYAEVGCLEDCPAKKHPSMTHPPQPPEPDIVERLTFLASGQDDPHSVAIAEAADEITRLRAALYERAAVTAESVQRMKQKAHDVDGHCDIVLAADLLHMLAAAPTPPAGEAPAPACPECQKPMVHDSGEPMTRDHPGEPPCWFCSDCGLTL